MKGGVRVGSASGGGNVSEDAKGFELMTVIMRVKVQITVK